MENTISTIHNNQSNNNGQIELTEFARNINGIVHSNQSTNNTVIERNDHQINQIIDTKSETKTAISTDSKRIEDVKQEIEPKYKKYMHNYKPYDIYYGLGIENEIYLMTDKRTRRTGKWIVNNKKRERYSVDYWADFLKNDVEIALKMIDQNKTYLVPIFINSHTFTKCDKTNQHKTLFTKTRQINPNFNGKTIHETMIDKSEYYRDNYDKEFLFDGDTFEFATLDFYKTTVDKCIDELTTNKTKFISEVNRVFKEEGILKEYFGKELRYSTNYGIVNFLTNMNSIAICNNSTYHINITLPTQLDGNGNISDMELFKKEHSNAIRAIQWIEPLLIACYGSPDIFSIGDNKFAKGSLRLALSRYISAGTYDTNEMKEGKLLNNFEYDPLINSEQNMSERHIYNNAHLRDHWYKKYNKESGYVKKNMIGYDINYSKHHNHGIELRIFDFFPEKYLKDVINSILLVCQKSLMVSIPNPIDYESYEDQLLNSIKNGSDATINIEYVELLELVFGCMNLDLEYTVFGDVNDDEKNNKNKLSEVAELFQSLVDQLYYSLKDYDFLRQISPNMPKPIIFDYNSYMNTLNRNFVKKGAY